jgi:hypothetical protein
MNNGKKSNFDIGDLYKKISTGAQGEPSQSEVDSFLESNLSESQAKAVRELLADEEKTKAILNSEAARTLFKKFFGGKDNG